MMGLFIFINIVIKKFLFIIYKLLKKLKYLYYIKVFPNKFDSVSYFSLEFRFQIDKFIINNKR